MDAVGHDHDHAASTRGRLAIALAIIGGVLVVEILGAWLSGSLALLADAGHMASDGIGLLVALIASVWATRPATDRHTFGFRRVEVLAALFNGVLLTVVAVVVAVEAVRRLTQVQPDAPAGIPMLVVAGVGLLANVAAFLVLRGGDRRSMNMRKTRSHAKHVIGGTMVGIATLGSSIGNLVRLGQDRSRIRSLTSTSDC